MKIKISLLAGLAALGFASTASAQTVINITGATAFRAGAHIAIRTILSDGGATQVKYCWVGTAGEGGFLNSNRIIAEGTIGGQPFIIRTNQNGSTQGVRSVALQETPPNFGYLNVAGTAADRIVGGQALTAGIVDAPGSLRVEAGVIGRFAFSDVAQSTSLTPSPVLPGDPVGVVPFVFIANPGSPTSITNMTDQLHDAQWSTGQLPLSMYTGNPADVNVTVLNTGRDNGSGTRATILSETQYGPFRNVVQWGGPNDDVFGVTGAEGTGAVTAINNLGNGGQSSNRFVRKFISRTSSNVTVGEVPGNNVVIVSYLTLSDASAITNITGGAGVGAIPLNYNGFRYSEDNVKNGQYTLWGYQWFYKSADFTPGEDTFFNALVAAIPPTLDPLLTGIPITDMNVTRQGSDGGIILPD